MGRGDTAGAPRAPSSSRSSVEPALSLARSLRLTTSPKVSPGAPLPLDGPLRRPPPPRAGFLKGRPTRACGGSRPRGLPKRPWPRNAPPTPAPTPPSPAEPLWPAPEGASPSPGRHRGVTARRRGLLGGCVAGAARAPCPKQAPACAWQAWGDVVPSAAALGLLRACVPGRGPALRTQPRAPSRQGSPELMHTAVPAPVHRWSWWPEERG